MSRKKERHKEKYPSSYQFIHSIFLSIFKAAFQKTIDLMQQQIKNKSEWQHFHYWYTTALQGVFSALTMKHSQAPCSLWGNPGAAQKHQRILVQHKEHQCRANMLMCHGQGVWNVQCIYLQFIKKIRTVAWCLMSHWSAEIKINSLLCLHKFILDKKKCNGRRGFECKGFTHLDVSNKTLPILVSLRKRCQDSLEGQAVQTSQSHTAACDTVN